MPNGLTTMGQNSMLSNQFGNNQEIKSGLGGNNLMSSVSPSFYIPGFGDGSSEGEPQLIINNDSPEVKDKIKEASSLISLGNNTEAQKFLEELILNGHISFEYANGTDAESQDNNIHLYGSGET
jgi:hypothetical protein